MCPASSCENLDAPAGYPQIACNYQHRFLMITSNFHEKGAIYGSNFLVVRSDEAFVTISKRCYLGELAIIERHVSS